MAETVTTRCCIAGGGPAGMMLGFLLARAGIDVVVLEKHDDFLRDFRGDTIHPSTLELLDQLSLVDEFLKLPHSRVSRVQPGVQAEAGQQDHHAGGAQAQESGAAPHLPIQAPPAAVL